MINEAIQYVTDDDDATRTILVGGALLLFSFLIVPAIIAAGYVVRVLDRTMHGDDEHPPFDDWGGLFSDGLTLFVVAFVYSLIPAILGTSLAVIGGLSILASGGSDLGVAGGVMVVLVGGLVWLAVSLLLAYVLPAAVANAVEHDDIAAGFDFGAIREAVSSGAYFSGWLYALAIMFGAGIVASILNVVPVIGFLATPFVVFPALVAAYYIIGHTWSDVHAVELGGEEVTDEQPAV